MQVGFTPSVSKDRPGIYGSIGVDDPSDAELVSMKNRDWRIRNLVVAGNMVYSFTP